MKIVQDLEGIEIKSRKGLRPILAFYYTAQPDGELLSNTLRFMGVNVRAVYPSRKGTSVMNVAVREEADIETVIASLKVPFRERRLRRY